MIHAGGELIEIERLYDVIGGAEGKGEVEVGAGGGAGENDDWDGAEAGPALDPTQGLEAVHGEHINIEHDEPREIGHVLN